MKAILLILLFSAQIAFGFGVVIIKPNQPLYIICTNNNLSELEIEVDKYESLPPLSEIKLTVGKKVIKTRAPKALISLETDPPEFAYKFIFTDNTVFDFLQVNITRQSARVIYFEPKTGFALESFTGCTFTFE